MPLPSLVPDLAKNVDQVLDAALGTLPPVEEGFIIAKQRRYDVRNLDTAMTDERAVGDFYLQTTAKYCMLVASMLALHPSSPEWQSLLSWTQSPFSAVHGIMNAQLRFMGEGDGQQSSCRI